MTCGCCCCTCCDVTCTFGDGTLYTYYQVSYGDWTTVHSPLSIAFSMHLEPLTYNADVPTELSIRFPEFFKEIGKATIGKLLLIELYSSSPAHIPFTYINNPAAVV